MFGSKRKCYFKWLKDFHVHLLRPFGMQGWDKTYCLQFVEKEFETIHFFGDKTYKVQLFARLSLLSRLLPHNLQTYKCSLSKCFLQQKFMLWRHIASSWVCHVSMPCAHRATCLTLCTQCRAATITKSLNLPRQSVIQSQPPRTPLRNVESSLCPSRSMHAIQDPFCKCAPVRVRGICCTLCTLVSAACA